MAADYPIYHRADGNMVCNECGKTYYQHPLTQEFLSFDGTPYLRKLCGGELVKL